MSRFAIHSSVLHPLCIIPPAASATLPHLAGSTQAPSPEDHVSSITSAPFDATRDRDCDEVDSSSDDDDDPVLSAFSDGLFSLYDEYMPAHGTPGHLYTYHPPPPPSPPPSDGATPSSSTPPRLEPMTVRIPRALDTAHLVELQAQYLWRSGIRLADLIVCGRRDDCRRRAFVDIEAKRVVELGAGVGLPGLVAARCGAAHVTLSDYDDDKLIANLSANVSLALPPHERARVIVVGHTWGESWPPTTTTTTTENHPSSSSSKVESGGGEYDVVLLADTLWYSDSHDALLSTLAQVLARTPEARVAVVAGLHSGRHTVRAFLRKATARGLVPVGEWLEVDFEDRERPWIQDDDDGDDDGGASQRDRGGREEESMSARNRWVVQGLLRWAC